MEFTVKITAEEAMLVDWLLTLHAYDEALLARLTTPEFKQLRKKVASAICNDSEETITLTDKDLEYLLIVTPITFRFYKADVGFSLKRKLLNFLVPLKISWSKESADAPTPDPYNNSAAPDSSADYGTDQDYT